MPETPKGKPNQGHSPWDDALKGFDFSKLDKGQSEEYPPVSDDEIQNALGTDPLKADLLRLAQSTAEEARAQAEGRKPRERVFHDMGWDLSLETPKGIVGLWSCWLGNQFFLGYPKTLEPVLASVGEADIIDHGNRLYRKAMRRNGWRIEKELDYPNSRHMFEDFTDEELRQYLRDNNIKFTDYPYIQVPDYLIEDTLGVELAEPVPQVNATAVNDENYEGEFKDSDLPLETNEVGQIVAYQRQGDRLWAKFYGPKEKSGGKVWIDVSGFNSNAHHFPHITPDGQLEEIYYGHEQSMGISTFPFGFWNYYSPEGPTADPEAIQKYRDRFILLAAKIGFLMGGVQAVNIDYGFSMVPEDFYREDYLDVTWLKGNEGTRQGWGNEVVRAKKNDATVILKSGNSLVPWSTTLRTPLSKLKSPEATADFIKDAILYF